MADNIKPTQPFSDDIYKDLFKQARDGMFIANLDGFYVAVNPSGHEMLGYPFRALVGKHISDILRAKDHLRLTSALEIIRGGESLTWEWTLLRKDGSTLETEITAQQVSNGHIIGVVRNLSDRRDSEQILRTAEGRLWSLINALPDPALIVDRDIRVLACNDALAKSFGKVPAEVIGRPVSDFLPDSPVRTDRFLRTHQVFENGTPQIFEDESHGKIFRNHFYPVTSIENKVASVAIFALDITQQKQMENVLRASESQLRSVLETAPDFILTVDRQGKILFINRTIPPTVAADVVGTSCFDYVPPESRARVAQAIEYVHQTRNIDSYETEGPPGLNGQRVWTHVRVGPLIAGDQVIAVTMCATDISVRKATEQSVQFLARGTAAQAGQEFFKSLVGHLAKGLNADFVFVSRPIPENKNRVRSIAAWALGAPSESVEYDLKNTPCDAVMGKNVCVYSSGVQARFPEDKPLVDLGIESYIGAPLFGASGNALGILVAMWKTPLANAVLAESMVRVFAAQAGTELERIQTESQLHFTMHRLSLATKSAHIGIWDWDLRSNILTCDERMCLLYGLPYQESGAAYEAWETRIHPDDLSRFRTEVRDAIDGIREFHSDFRVVTPEGVTRHLEGHAVLQHSVGGSARRLIGVNWDISKRKNEEAQRKELFERLQKIAVLVPGVVFQFKLRPDGSSCFPYASEGIREIYRVTPDEVSEDAAKVYAILHPDDYEGIVDSIQVSAQTLRPWKYEYRVRYPDGEERWLYGNSVPEKHADGSVLWHGFISDITERKMAEQSLRESEARYRTLVEYAPEAIVVLDLDTGKFIDVNENSEFLFRYSREELLEMGPLELSPATQPDGSSSAELAMENIRRAVSGEAPRFEWIHRDSKGLEIPCEIQLVRLPSAGRTVIRGSIVDISERKRIEESRAQLEAQLQHSQKVESIGRLAGGVAHDFNNLLTSVLGFSELAKSQMPEGTPAAKCVDRVIESALRGSKLTQQLLSYARKKIVKPEAVDLNSILNGMEALLQRLIGEHIELEFSPEPGLGTVKVDIGSIEQVIMNLAVNARDAMPLGGKLTMETANTSLSADYARAHPEISPGPFVMLAVSDSGEGMTPEILNRIFEPFFTTKPVGQGTGLGLAMCQGIVKQAGGHLAVYSEPQKGATFKIYLPRVDEAEERAIRHPLSQKHPRGNETILLVEDDEMILEMSREILSELGYQVLTASNGEEALQVAANATVAIQILVTDVVMPKLGGKELASRLKALNPALKILYASGYTENAIVHHGVLQEGVNFIQKPYTLTALSNKVREVLQGA